MSFKVGDVVTLKSGSDDLTVVLLGNNNSATVMWYDMANSSFKFEQYIPFEALTLKKD